MNQIRNLFCITLTLLALQLSGQEQPIHNSYEAPDPQEEKRKPYVIGGGAVAVIVAVLVARQRRKRRKGRS